nr:hypothetical protein [Tanacetum cinerariifolium]
MPIPLAILSPTKSSSYSDLLLVLSNLKRRALVCSMPLGPINTRPDLDPFELDSSFVNNIYSSVSSLLGVTFGIQKYSYSDSPFGISVMKSASTCPFTTFLGWSMMTITECILKYRLNLLVMCTSDNANFSIGA